MAIASFSFAVRAPHPAATGGGFGFGKFCLDEPPSLRYGSAGQGCLGQKWVVQIFVHLIRPAATFSPARRRKVADETFAQVKRQNCSSVHDFLPVR